MVRRLGGVSDYWRFDRMATVCDPGSGRLSASFAPVLAHYGADYKVCPARRGNRKGVVEKANHTAAQRWWRTLADELSPTQAQAELDRFCARVGDRRARRRPDGTRTMVAGLAKDEGLRPAPTAPFPAELSATGQVTAQALVPFRGNWYSIGPGRGGDTVTVVHRLGTAQLEVRSGSGTVLARITASPTTPARSPAPTSTWSRSSTRCWPRSPTGPPAGPRCAGHRPRPPAPRPPG